MFLRAFYSRISVSTKPGHPAEVHLPVKLGMGDAEAAFAFPLDRRLRASGLGQVTGTAVQRDGAGGIDGIDLFAILTTLHPRALKTLGGMLEDLDAPAGSSVRFSETGAVHVFGRTEGLGLYLDGRDAKGGEDSLLDVLEACTDALDGAGVYQGSAELDGRQVLYFYGDSFNAMKNALNFVLSTNPLCRGAFARRIG